MRSKTAGVATLLVAFMLVLSGQVHAGQVRFDAALGQPVLAAGKKNIAYLKVGLTGFELVSASERPPTNVALVLDRSGSMSGEKLRHAKQAAIAALERLNRNDIVSVVIFDNRVEVVFPATKLTDRAAVRNAIEQITAGGGTALFAGVSKGAEEVRKFIDRDRVNRVILLSDGQANEGPSSPSELAALGHSLRKEGMSVSTLGLGSDYNEDLMSQLARRSDGNHYFVASSNDLDNCFKSEFGDVLTVVAQEATIKIRCADGIRPVRLLGREGEITGQDVHININQIYSKQEKFALLEVEIPAGEAGRTRDIANVSISYANMATKTTDKMSNSVSASFSTLIADVEKSENAKVMVDAVSLLANERSKEATTLRDQGKIEAAAKCFSDNAAWVNAQNARYKSKELETCVEINVSASKKVIDNTDWKESRKYQRAIQSQLDLQQKR